MKNIQLKLLISFLIVFSCALLWSINGTKAIYKEVKGTTISMSVVDPSSNHTVTLQLNDGTGNYSTVVKAYNAEMGSDLFTPTRTNYNFMGWYDTNNRRIYPDEQITSDVVFHAVWSKIVCKKVGNINNLNTETCVGSNGCLTSNVGYAANDTITYGSIFGDGSPVFGDAYDCDVYYNSNSDTFDETDEYGKHIERFYFIREKENNGGENTAVLIYYTSFDSNGRVDSQHKSKDNIGSTHYDDALTWLPTSTTWTNPGLVDFDSQGKISRFLSVDDLVSMCGNLSGSGTGNTSYFINCFGGNKQNWFLFENSRFQSDNLGRAGIWLETDGVKYYRIHTGSISVMNFSNGNDSDNTARPVIEIPMSALDGFINADRYTVSFETHDGTSVSSFRRYEGEMIGTIPSTTRENYIFDGWYATYSNGVYSNPVSSSTVVHSDLVLHAKWIASSIVAVVENVGQYETLADAFANVPTTGVKTKVTLLQDVTFAEASDCVSVENNQYIDFDLNGHSVSGGNDGVLFTVNNGGKLEVGSSNGSGSINNTGDKMAILVNGTANNNEGTLYIKDGISINSTGSAPAIGNRGDVYMTGGTITCSSQQAAVNTGVANDQTISTAQFIMSGGSITTSNSKKNQAIYNNGGSRVEISGNAYLYSQSSSSNYLRATVHNYKGTLIINGGTIVSKNYAAVVTGSGNSTTTTIGSDDGTINITTPVLRGKTYGLEGTNAYIYDGIFESETNSRAINVTNITKPNANFYDTTVSVENDTYYATYLLVSNFTINFYPENGENTITKTITNGSAIGSDMPSNPIRTDYYFDGWYDNNTLITSETVPNSDINAYARWVRSITDATISNTLSVEKNTNETIVISGNDIESRSFASSNTNIATVDANGVVTGVNVGTTTITITGSKSGDQITVTVTVTSEMHTVRFYKQEGQAPIAEVTVADNGSLGVNMPGNPTEANYVFDRWVFTADNTLTQFTSETQVLGDVDVYATWKEKVTYATLTYSPNPFIISVGSTGQISLSATDQGGIVENYLYSSDTPSVAMVNSNGQVTGVSVGTAIISITGSDPNNPRTIQVTISEDVHQVHFYDDDGETELYQAVSVNDGETIGASMPNDPTKSGYEFDGWIFNDGNSLTPLTSATEIYGNIDAIAVWKEPINTATIASSINVRIGDSKQIILTPTGSRAVENFTITSSNSNILDVDNHNVYGVDIGSVTLTITGSLSHLSRTITINVTNTYEVVFKDDSDNILETIYVEIGDSIDNTANATLPTNPTKSGYTFDDWYLYDGNSVTNNRLDTSAIVSNDLIYKPRWAGEDDVAAIGTTYYTTYKAAIDDVPTTNVETEVRLLKDVYSTGFANNRGKIAQGKNVLLNGNNHTLTCSGGNAIWNEGTITIKNVTVTCGESKNSPIDNANVLIIIDSTVTMTLSGTDGRGAIYNGSSVAKPTTYGSVTIKGNSIISTIAKDRSAVQNAKENTIIDIQGGTISQLAADSTKYAVEVYPGSSATISGGTITSVNNYAVSNDGGTLTITGGSITSQNSTGVYNTGTLTIGTTTNNTYDVTTPVIQGELYGINSSSNYSIYDGIIKGKSNSQAVNDFSKITGTENGYERVTGTDGGYYTLYYQQVEGKYRINFNGNGGTVSDQYIEYDLNQQITANDLATATRGVYTFDGWCTDPSCNYPFVAFTPDQADEVTYYANWSYSSTTTPVSHVVTSDAMTNYFVNVNTWASADAQIAVNQDQSLNNDDHTTYLSTMLTNFNNYSCSECEINSTRENMNSCNSPSVGTYCDQPKGYDTGIEDDLDVYLYLNNAKSGSKLNGSNAGDYIKSDNGVIYNMIPGLTYYWESQNDSSIYGVVSVTKDGTHYRRTLKSSIRNLRDLGGMSVSYTENGVTTTGTIKYGKLYRGAQNAYGVSGITELQKLGITREVDLRATGDGNSSQTKFSAANYDVSISDSLYTRFYNTNTYTSDGYKDVKITNYKINPVANDYFQQANFENYKDLKQAMKAIMRQVVNHEVVFFHCTIGTDRTGTMAYFLEGLLGVSDEDRLRDYELTFFFGLTNRSRFHNNLSTSSINPRFYAMYKSYPDVSDIEDFYFNYFPESDDASLLTAFRNEMIQQ